MANYKRRSRRRDKRTMLPCGCCEDIRGGSKQLPIEDAPCMGKKKAPKPRKPKEKCPVNGTHEWYAESETVHGHSDYGKPGYWKCDDCHWERGFYTSKFIYCPVHLIRRQYTEVIKTKTCIHCWTVKKKRPVRTYSDGRGRYLKKLVLKKRPVRF